MTLSHERLETVLTVPYRYFETITSTNDHAKQWLSDGAIDMSVVIADEQRTGRGRKGRTWYTPPGVALAVSIIMRDTEPTVAMHSSMIGALAVAELCDEVDTKNVGIKWPNDVQIAGKKVSGILPEAVWQGDELLGVVLGIGVNVRVPFEGELATTATSLETACACRLDRLQLVAMLVERVVHWANQPSVALLTAWQARLTTLGQRVASDEATGVARSVDAAGALIVEDLDTGATHRIVAGDLTILPQQN